MMRTNEKLETIRVERGHSQTDAGELLGVGKSMISKIENGHTRPSLDLAVRICDVYGIAVAEWTRPNGELPQTDPTAGMTPARRARHGTEPAEVPD